MTENNQYNLDWKLICNTQKAISLIEEKVETSMTPWFVSGKVLKGNISGNNFTIRTKLPGMRGFSGAIAEGVIISEGKCSRLRATIKLSWPLNLFIFSVKTNIIIALSMVASWLTFVISMVFKKTSYISSIIFPICFALILIVNLMFMAYLSKSELNTLRNFFVSTFSSNRE